MTNGPNAVSILKISFKTLEGTMTGLQPADAKHRKAGTLAKNQRRHVPKILANQAIEVKDLIDFFLEWLLPEEQHSLSKLFHVSSCA